MSAQSPENVPENGWCGEPPLTAEDLAQFTCATGYCCGKAIAAGAGEETAMYTCQKNGSASYKPMKMQGYSQYDAQSDWVFQCPPSDVIENARALVSGLTAMLIAVLIYLE